MTVNTENLAWQWAMDNITNDDVKTRTAAEHILTTTTPMTMADVEWDDKKHDMAGAITMRGTETVMIRLDMCTDWIVTLIGKVDVTSSSQTASATSSMKSQKSRTSLSTRKR